MTEAQIVIIEHYEITAVKGGEITVTFDAPAGSRTHAAVRDVVIDVMKSRLFVDYGHTVFLMPDVSHGFLEKLLQAKIIRSVASNSDGTIHECAFRKR